MQAVLLRDPNATMQRELREDSASALPGLGIDIRGGYILPVLSQSPLSEWEESPVLTEAAAASPNSIGNRVLQADSSAQTEEPVEIVRTVLDTDEGARRGFHLRVQADLHTPTEEGSGGWNWADLGATVMSALYAIGARGRGEE